jgi:hypothetical protein
LFELFSSIVKFFVEAVYTYAASEQGSQELKNILDTAEADGIDIPFYEPAEGIQGDRGGMGDIGSNQPIVDLKSIRGKSWAEKHPDLARGGHDQ